MKRCPHCGQPFPEPLKRVRACYDCKEPILLHHKWKWAERAGVATSVHRHCDNPGSYSPAGEPMIAPAPLFDGGGA